MINYSLRELKNNEKGFALLGVIIMVVICAMISLGVMITSSGEASLVQKSAESTQVFYVAESALNGIAFALTTQNNWNDSIWSDVSSVDTSCGSAELNSIIFSDAAQTATVTVTGSHNGEQRQLEVTFLQNNAIGSTYLPGAASFKAASPEVNGNLTVDGRNHDRDCTLISDQTGVHAIALEESDDGTFLASNAVDLGATSGGADWGLSNTTDERVLFDVTDLPDTPDEAFGLSEGDLKTMSQSSGGHYYDFTEGVDNSAFTVYDGVNYIDMPCGADWQPNSIVMDDDSSDAILVIHAVGGDPDNPCSNSIYKAVGGGSFRGILIVDNIDKLHVNVIGAILGVGSNSGMNLGNGDGSVCYSSDVIADAMDSSGGDSGPGSISVASWQENHLY